MTKLQQYQFAYYKNAVTGAVPLSDDHTQMNLDVEIPDGWQSSEHLKEENGERLAFDRLRLVLPTRTLI